MVTLENLVATGFFSALLYGVGRAAIAATRRKQGDRGGAPVKQFTAPRARAWEDASRKRETSW
jgi:hypothetical protein